MMRWTMTRVAECCRLDMWGTPAPSGPVERITNGDFSLLGTLWDILSGGWTIALGLATNVGVGLSAGMSQTFGQPFTSADATLQIDVDANLLNLSTLHAEIVTTGGTIVAYNDNPSAGLVTVNNIVISNPATALRLYVTGSPGIVIDSVSLIA
jgi:hypothetical protein